jgi:hypothetical protein
LNKKYFMKKLFSFVLAVITMGAVNAQFIKTDVGASIFVGVAKIKSTNESTSASASFYGISWYPRYMVTNKISVGAPLTLGFSGSANSQTGSSFSFGLDVPVAVDYNFGYGAAGGEEESDATFGGFIGGGFGYTKSASSDADDYTTSYIDETDYSKASSYGPMAHAGVRFPIKQGEQSITLRLSFKKGLEKTKFNFFGGTLLYGF